MKEKLAALSDDFSEHLLDEEKDMLGVVSSEDSSDEPAPPAKKPAAMKAMPAMKATTAVQQSQRL